MAKTKLRSRLARRGLHFRKVHSYVDVARVPEVRELPFLACVRVGGEGRIGILSSHLASCAYGKNPRKAIAAAMRKAASKTGGRRGAFAGLGRR